MSNNHQPPKRLSPLAEAVMGQYLAPVRQLPTIQAGWTQMAVLMEGRGWPENVIEAMRQAYFAGAARLHDIIVSMPMDANIVGRVHEALYAELRDHEQELVERREAGKPDAGAKT